MRGVLALVLLGGCIGGGVAPSGGGTRPGVMPMLSELPSDSTRRDAILDSSARTAGPEQRSGLTAKERAAETAGATAAAILGGLFSKTQNVTLGAATMVDEGGGSTPRPARHAGPPRAPSAEPIAPAVPAADGTTPPAPAPTSDTDPPRGDLVPWIKLQ